VPGVRGIGCGLAFVAGAILVTTSAIFEATAQPVEDLGEPPGIVHGEHKTQANLETKANVKGGGAARRVPCDQVISRVDREGRRHKDHEVEISLIARNLNTSVAWVERCMLAYGRRPGRSGGAGAEATERRLERLEEEEPEELGPEEIEERGSSRARELRERQPPQAVPRTPKR
jgi:hypothetical protein